MLGGRVGRNVRPDLSRCPGLPGGLKMFLKRSTLCLGLVVATALCLSFGGERPADEKGVQQLIRNLGSKHFKVREEAERQLLEREDAAPALHRIVQTPGTDREVV